MVFISRLVPTKNLDLVLESLHILKKRGINPSLTVVGNGPNMKRYKRFVIDNSLIGEVAFLGQVSKNEVLKLLLNFDLFIVPQKAEGFGISLLEVMAAGVPTVSGRVDGIGEMIRDGKTGFIVNINNPGELVKLIDRVKGNDFLLRNIAIKAREKVRSFSWENQSEKILEVYDSVMLRRVHYPNT